MSKTIFVTGGTGLVGSHLLLRLASSGQKVRAIFRKNINLSLTRKVFGYYSENADELLRSIEWIECDICNYERLTGLLKDVGTVYHCAATVSFEKDQAESIITNNVTTTANIVRSCIENGVEKLCHVSSTAALGSSDFEDMVDEKHGWDSSHHHSGYAISKHLSEQEVWKGIQNGLKAVIVNPSVIFGPGDWGRGSSQYFSTISKGMLFYTDGVTGYVDVNDVTLAMITLMNSDISGERFIVSSENLSFREVFKMIAGSLNTRKPVIYVPKVVSVPAVSLMNLIYGLSGTKSPVTTDNIKSAYSRVTFDSSKIIAATGITFKKIEHSIADTCKIFLGEIN